MAYQLEICTNSVQSAINAQAGGADRIELCDNLWEGGTTPSLATIEITKQQIQLPVFVLIRPRGGDFVYSALEFEIMKRDIILAKGAGADGIVSGALNPDGTIDLARTKELVLLSKPLLFTFHRAFDLTPDPAEALEQIILSGATRVLTSGQQSSALAGKVLIHKLISQANDRLVILAGGGVNKGSVEQLKQAGATEFHLSAKSYFKGLAEYEFKVPMNGSKEIPEDRIAISDTEKIQEVRKILDATS